MARTADGGFTATSKVSVSNGAGKDGNGGDIHITDTAPGWASQNGGTTGGGTDLAGAVTVNAMGALQSEASGASNMNDSRGSVFSIPYGYPAIPASEVKAAVTTSNCGAGNTCQLAQ
jgi:hypothetical protein